MNFRTMYMFHHLSETAKIKASKLLKKDTSIFFFNVDGSKFIISTTIQL